jgi:hypothetical protein
MTSPGVSLRLSMVNQFPSVVAVLPHFYLARRLCNLRLDSILARARQLTKVRLQSRNAQRQFLGTPCVRGRQPELLVVSVHVRKSLGRQSENLAVSSFCAEVGSVEELQTVARSVWLGRAAKQATSNNVSTKLRRIAILAKTVIPTAATRLFPARGFCVPGSEVEGPWRDQNRADTDEINYTLSRHSYKLRIANTGSTLVARRAGTKHATSATPHNNSEISANVIGSVALTP